MSQTHCWQVGAETSIFGMRGYLVAQTDDCTTGEVWNFEVSDSVPGAFEIHSTSDPGFSLDVQESAKEDGTNVITYGSHSLANQRFFVKEATPGVYEFSPAHVTTSCISERIPVRSGESAIQITSCKSGTGTQLWELLPAGCSGGGAGGAGGSSAG